VIARKQSRLASAAESSNCRKRIPHTKPIPKEWYEKMPQCGVSTDCTFVHLELSCVSEGAPGDTRCKDYIPRFPVAGPALVCFCCVPQLVLRRPPKEFSISRVSPAPLRVSGYLVWPWSQVAWPWRPDFSLRLRESWWGYASWGLPSLGFPRLLGALKMPD
jgi:hypothetical protein